MIKRKYSIYDGLNQKSYEFNTYSEARKYLDEHSENKHLLLGMIEVAE